MIKNLLKNTYLISAIILITLIIIFFNQQIFQNKTLVPLDTLKEFDLMFNDNILSHNYLLSDLVNQAYPNYSFSYNSIKNKSIPFWNPNILTGIPFFADCQTGFFEFTHILSYLFKITPLKFPLFSALITSFILGLSFFIYIRNLKINFLISLFGSIVLMFSGTTIVWTNYSLISAFIWLPLMLFCADKITSKKDFRFLSLLAIVISFSLFAGYPQIALINLIILILYLILRLKQNNNFKIANIGLISIFILLGVLISAIQIGPSWDFIKKSESYIVGRGYIADTNFSKTAKDQFVNFDKNINIGIKKIFRYGILTILPEYYGTPIHRNYHDPENNPFSNFNEITIYSGFLTILLAILSIIFIKKGKSIIFWLITSILSFALAINLPILGLLKYLPLINKISMSRFRLFFVFSIIILAVYALQKISDYYKDKNKTIKILIIILIIISYCDLFCHFHNYNYGNIQNTNFIYNDSIKFLKNNTKYERVVGIGIKNKGFCTPLLPNISMLTDLYDIRGYNPIISKGFIDLADEYLTRRGSFVLLDDVFNENIIDMMSVKYLICPKNQCPIINNKNYTKEYENNNIYILKNSNFLPRAYIAYDIIKIPKEKIIQELGSENFNPHYQVMLDDKENITLNKNAKTDIQSAEIIKYQPNEVVIRAHSDKSGILILTDSYDDGWNVTINNKKGKILLVNGIFRGVLINSGNSEIIFKYLPKHFYVYLYISIFSILSLIVGAIILIKKKTRL